MIKTVGKQQDHAVGERFDSGFVQYLFIKEILLRFLDIEYFCILPHETKIQNAHWLRKLSVNKCESVHRTRSWHATKPRDVTGGIEVA